MHSLIRVVWVPFKIKGFPFQTLYQEQGSVMGGRKIKGHSHSHEIFSSRDREAEAMCQFRSVSTRWHHSTKCSFVVICFLIMGQLSVLADIVVLCGKLVGGWGGIGCG